MPVLDKHATGSPVVDEPPQHVRLPKPRQPTKHSSGEDWIKVRIELESDVKVEKTYSFYVEYKKDGTHGNGSFYDNGLSSVFSAPALTGGEKYLFRVRVLEKFEQSAGLLVEVVQRAAVQEGS